jgi:hypothetical protein
VLAVASEGFAVVVDVGARADPIYPMGVRLDYCAKFHFDMLHFSVLNFIL